MTKKKTDGAKKTTGGATAESPGPFPPNPQMPDGDCPKQLATATERANDLAIKLGHAEARIKELELQLQQYVTDSDNNVTVR